MFTEATYTGGLMCVAAWAWDWVSPQSVQRSQPPIIMAPGKCADITLILPVIDLERPLVGWGVDPSQFVMRR